MTNIRTCTLQQLEPHLAQQLAQALAAGCILEECAAECRSLSEHEELFAGIRTDEAAELQEMTSPTDEVEYADENDPEEGASTAEYGIVMLAAVGFAGLLVAILKSDEISRHARRYGQERPCNGRFWADLWAFLNPVLPVKTARVAQTPRKERL